MRAMRWRKIPNAKFAVISQNDDFGRDYLLGLKDVLGDKYDSLVTAATYEVQDPTINSQIVKLKASGADVFVIAATPKFAAQSIRKAFEIGWRPMTFLSNVAVWVSTVMEPAGLEAGIGILSTAYVKDPDDPAWKDDAGVKGWREFMIKYVPDGDLHDTNYVNAYNSAMALEAVLKACGDDLSTENILKQAYAIKDLELPMLLPGIKVNTSPDRSRAGRPDAVHALQRQDLGAVRRVADRELNVTASFPRDARMRICAREKLPSRPGASNLKISSRRLGLLLESVRARKDGAARRDCRMATHRIRLGDYIREHSAIPPRCSTPASCCSSSTPRFSRWLISRMWIYDPNGLGIPTDFVNVWAAGRLVLDGHPALAYDWDIQKQIELALLGQDFPAISPGTIRRRSCSSLRCLRCFPMRWPSSAGWSQASFPISR